jgi:hypothetical protein
VYLSLAHFTFAALGFISFAIKITGVFANGRQCWAIFGSIGTCKLIFSRFFPSRRRQCGFCCSPALAQRMEENITAIELSAQCCGHAAHRALSCSCTLLISLRIRFCARFLLRRYLSSLRKFRSYTALGVDPRLNYFLCFKQPNC